MTREDRIRAVLPDAGEDLITRLAALPTAAVADVVTAVKHAHRDGRAHEVAVRKQRRDDRRKHGHIDDGQLAAGVERQTFALGNRAGQGSLEALARLKEHYDDGPSVLTLAVAGLRSEGYSDSEIGLALGVTRMAVGQRFGRKGTVYAGT